MNSALHSILHVVAAGLLYVALSTPCVYAATPDRFASWQGYMEEASRRYRIPYDWIARVMLAESGGRSAVNGLPLRSRAGALGLMQVMPLTYRVLRQVEGLGDDPKDPHDNIMAGTAYLRDMYDAFGYPGLFGAYNAGPKRYEESLHGKALPKETQSYLLKLTLPRTALSGADLPIARPSSAPTLFIVSTGTSPTPSKAQDQRLFVSLQQRPGEDPFLP